MVLGHIRSEVEGLTFPQISSEERNTDSRYLLSPHLQNVGAVEYDLNEGTCSFSDHSADICLASVDIFPHAGSRFVTTSMVVAIKGALETESRGQL